VRRRRWLPSKRKMDHTRWECEQDAGIIHEIAVGKLSVRRDDVVVLEDVESIGAGEARLMLDDFEKWIDGSELSAAESIFLRPMSGVVWMIWR